MTISVREVLDLEQVRLGAPEVLSGAGRLDRAVRWVHVAELPDIAYLLRGGELLLTTGMGIAGQDQVQLRYVAELADAGVAGLVIELGRNFAEIPAGMVAAAEEHGLPLIALHRETRFVEVTEAVHRTIINRQYALLRRAEDVSRDLTELILSGADVSRIVARLADIFRNLVVLEDEAGQIMELGDGSPGAGGHRDLGDTLSSWEEHSRSGHDETSRGAIHRHDGSPRCIWVGIWLRHRPWGRLHVLETGSRVDEITELLIDRAGAALALALLSEKDAAAFADRARSALIGELVAGRHGSMDDFVRRARTVGVDLAAGRLAAVALAAVRRAPQADGQADPSEDERLHTRLFIADRLRIAVRGFGGSALVGFQDDRVIGLVSVPGTASLARVLEQVVDEVAERVQARGRQLSVIAGVSGEVAVDRLADAVEDATTALRFGRGVRDRRVHHYGDLGTYPLLVHLAQGPELARFVESELRPLLEHDAHTRAKLRPTLQAYLNHAGRKAEAAQALRIQRRTLYARLRRLEAMFQRDLDDQETRTRLTLALHGLDLLNGQRAP